MWILHVPPIGINTSETSVTPNAPSYHRDNEAYGLSLLSSVGPVHGAASQHHGNIKDHPSQVTTTAIIIMKQAEIWNIVKIATRATEP